MTGKPILGAYVSEPTPVSALDARVKILALLTLTVAVFAAATPYTIAAWYVLLAFTMRVAHIDPRASLRALRPVAIVLAFTLCANLISCDGTAPLSLAGPVGLNPTGGLRGLMAVLRIALLLGFALVVSSSTTPPQLADACVRLLRPLSRWGVPVGAIGTVLSLALRFIPIVAEEFQRIQLAQRARGVRFDAGSLLARVRVWTSVLTPLVVGLFRRADRLAESMAARCYSAAGEVAVPCKALTARDKLVLAGALALVLALTAWALLG